MWNESFFSAPQLKRDPLGSGREREPGSVISLALDRRGLCSAQLATLPRTQMASDCAVASSVLTRPRVCVVPHVLQPAAHLRRWWPCRHAPRCIHSFRRSGRPRIRSCDRVHRLLSESNGQRAALIERCGSRGVGGNRYFLRRRSHTIPGLAMAFVICHRPGRCLTSA